MFRRVGKNHSLMDMRCAHRRSRSATASALCAAAIGFVGLSQRTAAQTWTGGAGERNVAANWSNGAVPNPPTTAVSIEGGNYPASTPAKLLYSLSTMDIHSLTIDEGAT